MSCFQLSHFSSSIISFTFSKPISGACCLLMPGTWNGEPQGTQLPYLNLPEGLWLPKLSLVVSVIASSPPWPHLASYPSTYTLLRSNIASLRCSVWGRWGRSCSGSLPLPRCWAPGALPAHKKIALGVFSCECLFRGCRIGYGSVPVLYVKLNTRGHVRGLGRWGTVSVPSLRMMGIDLLLSSASCLLLQGRGTSTR